jgi:peptide/nickel transport system permease protein
MNKPLVAGAGILGIIVLLALAAPAASSFGLLQSPLAQDLIRSLEPPGMDHLFGTDKLGRDVLARLLHGSRNSLLIAFIAMAVALTLGVPAGTLAGFRGGLWDLILTRLMEATSGLPALPILLLVVSLTIGQESSGGSANIALLAGAIGITKWAAIARYVRGGIWQAQEEEFAAAAAALGASRKRILFGHLLPGALGPAMVSAAFGAGSAVLMESALSFLGMGTQPPWPSWGGMVSAAFSDPEAWWLLLAPGAAIALLVIAFNLLAEGVESTLSRQQTDQVESSGGGRF